MFVFSESQFLPKAGMATLTARTGYRAWQHRSIKGWGARVHCLSIALERCDLLDGLSDRRVDIFCGRHGGAERHHGGNGQCLNHPVAWEDLNLQQKSGLTSDNSNMRITGMRMYALNGHASGLQGCNAIG